MTYTEPPEPPTIAQLRNALAAHGDAATTELMRQAERAIITAARAVLAEWDRGVTARQEAVKAALRDAVSSAGAVLHPDMEKLIAPAEAVEPWHGKATVTGEDARSQGATMRIGRPRCSRCYQVGHHASACTVGL